MKKSILMFFVAVLCSSSAQAAQVQITETETAFVVEYSGEADSHAGDSKSVVDAATTSAQQTPAGTTEVAKAPVEMDDEPVSPWVQKRIDAANARTKEREAQRAGQPQTDKAP